MCFLCVLRVDSENVVPPPTAQIHTCLSHVFPETPVLGTAWDPDTLHRGKKRQTDRDTKNTVPLEHLQESHSVWELFSTPCCGKSRWKLMLAKIATLPESLSIRNSSVTDLAGCSSLLWLGVVSTWSDDNIFICFLHQLHRSGHLCLML